MKKQVQLKSREIKVETVKSLAQKIARAKTLAFCDYHGLTVNQLTDLRRKIKAVGGEIIVTKNTLMKLALQISDLRSGILDLVGPTAIVFAYSDEIAPLKVLADSAREKGLPKFKFGFAGFDLLDGQAIVELSQIPGRDVLHAKIVGALASPIYGFVSVLSANIRNLLSILDQVSKSASSRTSG